jgi:hypothetical protein
MGKVTSAYDAIGAEFNIPFLGRGYDLGISYTTLSEERTRISEDDVHRSGTSTIALLA